MDDSYGDCVDGVSRYQYNVPKAETEPSTSTYQTEQGALVAEGRQRGKPIDVAAGRPHIIERWFYTRGRVATFSVKVHAVGRG